MHQDGELVLVATPIGNLADISRRAIETLQASDLILCEDTRTSARLLREYGIHTKTRPLHDHNEDRQIPALLHALAAGQRIAVISDAGTPLMSDPGYRLVRAVVAEGARVSAVPGPNAAIMALTLSGLPPHPFLFSGFLPPREAARREVLARLHAAECAGLAATLIWHEAPHRLAEMLATLAAVLGPARPAAVARELTKRFEEVRRGTLADLAAHYGEHPARGEITVVVGPPLEDDSTATDLDSQLRTALRTLSVKDAAALVAGITSLPRRTVYARALELARDES
ncbi:16S rRNA (cytidine(1402)-2'-O)-methyltransferase [Komagataeibacter xylinus]|uniref:Ribosomal RNA small subunit methyltransferase I n=1 Tax=Komagataeibacter rhaeticus TaxID=215221 RepID=A0A181CB86_9PROT|nr:16S rRNA (cytidine(1402)-2'-O)-methyltransferase [Komagataeibacter rhaeticus]ATU74267.1 16S rRNA (cytidine(1402)-2'-O)-methyltransferase [Komagataeibacter xylinus]QIP37032.1 16S rRNA (cytidine(1402)-2'-O)-methyltransferase [Komagataeibacter rhaeticus]QOC48182.1 16S rRNA (cytidine(1402)-2'-O)-methyltransferase [Komagataeibacter rhaeticus]WPP23420.1 16S rRNA (cytidine(1402)-2'-O)-methyltransferase [Komagataeibacter rhaeticus]SAY48798.1 Ribosomal RNA small subunit methyltransferase I [Komagata